MKKIIPSVASLTVLVLATAFAAEPPAPPTREEWGFMKELAQRDPYVSHWTRAAKAGELDLSKGLKVIDEYGVKGDLATATDDLASFLSDIKLAGGETILRLVRRDCGGKEAYRLEVTTEGVALVAGDDDGLRRAIYFFEDRLLGSEAPALAFGATARKPWVRNRITRCFFGPIKRPPLNHDELMDDVDYYPEPYLDRLAHEGINGLWLTAEWRDLAETSFTKRSPDAARRLAKLRSTVDRCLKYGIKTWIFCIEPRRCGKDDPLLKEHPELFGCTVAGESLMCPLQPAAQRYIEESVKDIFTQVPRLGGIMMISYGERETTCLSRFDPLTGHFNGNCPRCAGLEPWQIHWETASAIMRGIRAAGSDAEYISWFYQPQVRPERGAWNAEVARHLPDGVTLCLAEHPLAFLLAGLHLDGTSCIHAYLAGSGIHPVPIEVSQKICCALFVLFHLHLGLQELLIVPEDVLREVLFHVKAVLYAVELLL